MSPLPLPAGSYALPAPAASSRLLLNCYAQDQPPENPRGQPITLVRAPGIAAWVDTAEVECRGAIIMGANLYVVAGSHVWRLTRAGALTQLTGDAISGSGIVKLATNGTAIAICPGNGDGFTCDGSTVTQITDDTFIEKGGADPVFLDGYVVFRRPGTQQFFNSDVNDLSTFNGLWIASKEGAPDNIIGMTVNHRELILAGDQTVERWYDAGNDPGSPFSRSPSGFHEQGCGAGNSLANQDNSVFMLGNDGTVRRLGDSWARVSQYGVEAAIQRFAQKDDCFAIPYRQEGHHFVAFTFRNAARTFVFDANTLQWHDRASTVNGVPLGYWRPAFVVEAWGKQIVGDSQSGKIGVLDPDTHTEFGDPQTVSVTFQPVYAANNLILHRRFELVVTSGQGAPGAHPQCTLHVSDDGGNTFATLATRDMGGEGAYNARLAWWALGSSRQRVYRAQFADPVRAFVLDAQLMADGARL